MEGLDDLPLHPRIKGQRPCVVSEREIQSGSINRSRCQSTVSMRFPFRRLGVSKFTYQPANLPESPRKWRTWKGRPVGKTRKNASPRPRSGRRGQSTGEAAFEGDATGIGAVGECPTHAVGAICEPGDDPTRRVIHDPHGEHGLHGVVEVAVRQEQLVASSEITHWPHHVNQSAGPRHRMRQTRAAAHRRTQVVSQQPPGARYLGRRTKSPLAHSKGRGKGDRRAKEAIRTLVRGVRITPNTLQRNDSHVGPPRGFEPRTYALRVG
jgi:hypothetical protein